MRERLMLLPLALLVAGCLQPSPSTETLAAPTPQGLVPTSLLVDRAGEALQAFVHAKQGNVRYDFLNLTLRNATGNASVSLADRYALDEPLPAGRVHVTVQAVLGEARYNWSGELALNGTAEPPTLRVWPWDAKPGFGAPREAALPWETLLAPEEAAR